jgi:hypothetical protein
VCFWCFGDKTWLIASLLTLTTLDRTVGFAGRALLTRLPKQGTSILGSWSSVLAHWWAESVTHTAACRAGYNGMESVGR